jgi:hypothetical protein
MHMYKHQLLLLLIPPSLSSCPSRYTRVAKYSYRPCRPSTIYSIIAIVSSFVQSPHVFLHNCTWDDAARATIIATPAGRLDGSWYDRGSGGGNRSFCRRRHFRFDSLLAVREEFKYVWGRYVEKSWSCVTVGRAAMRLIRCAMRCDVK